MMVSPLTLMLTMLAVAEYNVNQGDGDIGVDEEYHDDV